MFGLSPFWEAQGCICKHRQRGRNLMPLHWCTDSSVALYPILRERNPRCITRTFAWTRKYGTLTYHHCLCTVHTISTAVLHESVLPFLKFRYVYRYKNKDKLSINSARDRKKKIACGSSRETERKGTKSMLYSACFVLYDIFWKAAKLMRFPNLYFYKRPQCELKIPKQ